MSSNGYANPEVLVDTDWATNNLDNENIRFVEVDVDTSTYEKGHIPGAVGWNWQIDTQDAVTRDIPDEEAFTALVRRSGISNETTVVLYGDNNNWFATYAFWLLKYYGHEKVLLINGGRKKWEAEGRELVVDIPDYAPTAYQVTTIDKDIRALRDFVEASLEEGARTLIDVRSAAEYSGESLAPEGIPQEGSQRGGHIPGAANVPWSSTVADDGSFKPAKALWDLYEPLGVSPDKEVIAYCRIGERSSHTWFVLRYLLGISKVRNYDGSWTEWGSLIGVPIEKG
ncbi:MAG: sulfurtransferase [Chloroflexi bacterium]|nr:MAG: sulfurtransferase [Chloroflexota bacterium]MBL1192998.1 sulfurtransferase [Chloroflexota bacterium]NOH10291.1 sulfurtransferase [Chloroflexota bacterium]